MFAAAATLALFALPLASAQTTHVINVGGPGVLAYDPPSITAAVGDIMHFVFHQKNHTVTQSTFADPCTPMPGGFTSGFQPVPDTMTDGFPTCDWEVKTTNPIWAFCQQAGHCGQGMVFAVNAPSTGNTFAAFQTAAKATASSSSSPANSNPYGSSGSGSSSAAPAATSAATGTAAAPSSTGSAAPASGSPTVHVVTVGGSSLIFNPGRVDAAMGDIISFVFHSKNHSATQSSFAAPCSKIGAPITGTSAVFDSGFQPATETAPFPTYNVTVSTTSPMWFFCAQGQHCEAGMVFAVNSVESSANNYAAFVAKAKGAAGTAGNSTAPASTGSTSGALSRVVMSTGLSVGVIGAVVAFLL